MLRFKTVLVTVLSLALLGAASDAAWAQRGERTAGEPGWLGVSIQVITDDIRDALPRSVDEGVLVNSVVDGSPADKLGLEEGDVITSFDGKSVRMTEDLTRAVRDAGAGRTVDIEYYRDGRLQRGRVTLSGMTADDRKKGDTFRWRDRDTERDIEKRPGETRLRIESPKGLLYLYGGQPMLGVKLMDMGDQLAEYFGSKKGGALITEVMDESPADKAGLKAGDVIVRIDGDNVENSDDVRKLIRDQDDSESVTVDVLRRGRTESVSVQLEGTDSEWYSESAPDMPGMMFRHFGNDAGEFRMPPLDIEKFKFSDPERKELREQMDQLKKAVESLRRELSELKTERP